ncbi:hypothetical protein ACWCOP_13735 [Maricaulaceae bacterium MS644]
MLMLGDSLSRGPSPRPDGADIFDHPDLMFNAVAIEGGSPFRAYAPGQLLDEVAIGLARLLRPGDVLVLQDAGPHHGVAALAGLAVERLIAAARPGVRPVAVTAPADAHTPAACDWSTPLSPAGSANDAVREAARRCAAGVVDLERLRPVWDAELSVIGLRVLEPDGVHLTRAGGALYAAAAAGAAAVVNERAARALAGAVDGESGSRFTRLAASAMRSGVAAVGPDIGAERAASRGL